MRRRLGGPPNAGSEMLLPDAASEMLLPGPFADAHPNMHAGALVQHAAAFEDGVMQLYHDSAAWQATQKQEDAEALEQVQLFAESHSAADATLHVPGINRNNGAEPAPFLSIPGQLGENNSREPLSLQCCHWRPPVKEMASRIFSGNRWSLAQKFNLRKQLLRAWAVRHVGCQTKHCRPLGLKAVEQHDCAKAGFCVCQAGMAIARVLAIRLAKCLSCRGTGWLEPKSPLRQLYDRAHLVLRFCARRESKAASLNDVWWLVGFGNLNKCKFTGKIFKTAAGGDGASDSAVVYGTRGVPPINHWRLASQLIDSGYSHILMQAWKLSEAAVALEEHEVFVPAENVHVERVCPEVESNLWQRRESEDAAGSRRLALVPYQPGEGSEPVSEPESEPSVDSINPPSPREPPCLLDWHVVSSPTGSSTDSPPPRARSRSPRSPPALPPLAPPAAPPDPDPEEGAPRGRRGDERNSWDKIWCGSNGYLLCSFTEERDTWDIRAVCKRHSPCSYTFGCKRNKPVGACWAWLMEAANKTTRAEHADFKVEILADHRRRQEARHDFIAQEAETETFLREEFNDGTGHAVEPPNVRLA